MTSSTWYGPGGPYKTTYEPSQGGLVEKATPWRSAELADLEYLESGSLESAALGDDITGSLGYHPDGSRRSLGIAPTSVDSQG